MATRSPNPEGAARRRHHSVTQHNAPLAEPVTLRKATVEDAAAIVRSFNEIFRLDRTADYWRWKFDRGREIASMIAVDAKGEVLAQHAARPVRYWTPDTGEMPALVRADVFALRRSGVIAGRFYVKLLRSFFSAEGGFLSQYAFTAGFPNDVNYGILVRTLDHRYDFKLVKYARPLSWRDRLRASAKTETLRADDVDKLWQRVRTRYSFSVVKDWDWYRWRFLDKPIATYQFIAIFRRDGGLRGWAALARENNNLLLIDLTLEPDDRSGFVALESRMAAYGRSLGCSAVIGVLPPWFAETAQIERTGWRPVAEEQPQPMIIYDHGTMNFDLGPRPWYSFGDTDMF